MMKSPFLERIKTDQMKDVAAELLKHREKLNREELRIVIGVSTWAGRLNYTQAEFIKNLAKKFILKGT